MEKNIHQIWVGPYEMPDREKGYVQKMKEFNPGWQHFLWTDNNLPELPEEVRIRCELFKRQKDYAHIADAIRVFLVHKFGGIYLDVDFQPMGNLDDSKISESQGVFFYHGGDDYTMPNGCFGLSAGTEMGEYLLSQISSKFGGWYGPSWMGGEVKKFLGMEYESEHDLVDKKLRDLNIRYMTFYDLESNYCTHRALYSWSPENKRNFESGNINYLEDHE